MSKGTSSHGAFCHKTSIHWANFSMLCITKLMKAKGDVEKIETWINLLRQFGSVGAEFHVNVISAGLWIKMQRERRWTWLMKRCADVFSHQSPAEMCEEVGVCIQSFQLQKTTRLPSHKCNMTYIQFAIITRWWNILPERIAEFCNLSSPFKVKFNHCRQQQKKKTPN